MSGRRVARAVVLAAGAGSRLADGSAAPKPLKPVAGVPLIVRVLRTLQEAGIRQAVVVLGYQAELIRRELLSEPSLVLELVFVQNDRYRKKNGISLLAAAPFIDGDCVLSMADHLYSPELVRRLLAFELPEGACALGIDRDLERCFDLDDATKVVTAGDRIVEISKDLEQYDAIDTGVFRIGPALIEELAQLAAGSGDCSLSEGVQKLSQAGRFYACDVADSRWIDVDTPAALERAEAMIRVFGEALGDEPGAGVPPIIDPEAIEQFAPSWVRAASACKPNGLAIGEGSNEFVRPLSNESTQTPSPHVLNAIIDAAMRGDSPGAAHVLCRKLAARERLGDSSVLLGADSAELVDVVIRTFVSPGEELLVSGRSFGLLEVRARAVGGIPVLVPMTEEDEHDVRAILRAVTERTKVVFLCAPPRAAENRLALEGIRRLLRLGLPTVIDDTRQGLGESLAHVIHEFPNAIVLRALSEISELAGLRLGYALAHPVAIRLFSRIRPPSSLPSMLLAAAGAALDEAAPAEEPRAGLREAQTEAADAEPEFRESKIMTRVPQAAFGSAIQQLGAHEHKEIILGYDRHLLEEAEAYLELLSDYGSVIRASESNELHWLISAERVCNAVQASPNRVGVLICFTGIGVSIAANKFAGVYAARCVTAEDARLARMINNANVLCLASRGSLDENRRIVHEFFTVPYEGRKLQQLESITALELGTPKSRPAIESRQTTPQSGLGAGRGLVGAN